MDINKKSWHYIIVDYKFNSPSKSLCGYFWQVIGSIISIILDITFALGMICLGIFTLIMPFLTTNIGASVIGFLWWFIVLCILGEILKDMIHDYNPDSVFLKEIKLFPERKKLLTKDKEPNIIAEYVKAKKEKICPTLNFVDKE